MPTLEADSYMLDRLDQAPPLDLDFIEDTSEIRGFEYISDVAMNLGGLVLPTGSVLVAALNTSEIDQHTKDEEDRLAAVLLRFAADLQPHHRLVFGAIPNKPTDQMGVWVKATA